MSDWQAAWVAITVTMGLAGVYYALRAAYNFEEPEDHADWYRE